MNWGERRHVIVTKERHEKLLDAEKFLAALEAVGVDNWEGYEKARQLCNGEITEEDI